MGAITTGQGPQAARALSIGRRFRHGIEAGFPYHGWIEGGRSTPSFTHNGRPSLPTFSCFPQHLPTFRYDCLYSPRTLDYLRLCLPMPLATFRYVCQQFLGTFTQFGCVSLLSPPFADSVCLFLPMFA